MLRGTKMPVEVIGAGAERERIDTECHVAIKHLEKVCGEPPPEIEL